MTAQDFGARFFRPRVRSHGDMLFAHNVKEAWPACFGVELGGGFKQGVIARGAMVDAFAIFIEVSARVGRLGVAKAHDSELCFREALFPLFLCQRERL